MSYNFELKKTYSFDVYPSSVLGNDFSTVTVLSKLDYSVALNFADIPAIHENVFPFLPTGTPNRPEDYEYLLIRTPSGDQTIIGVPWIKEDTVVLKESLRMSITIEDVGTSDVEQVRAALVQNGYDKIVIKLID